MIAKQEGSIYNQCDCIFFLYDITLDTDERSMSAFSNSMRRLILAQYLCVTTESLSFSLRGHGKPILDGEKNIHFNISHTGHYWLMVISSNGEIGVDIEQNKQRKNMKGIISSYFHPDEYKEYKKQKTDAEKITFFYHIWTRKEAYAKYLGLGFSYNFSLHDIRNDHLQNINISTALPLSIKNKCPITISIAQKGNMVDHTELFGNTSLKELIFIA